MGKVASLCTAVLLLAAASGPAGLARVASAQSPILPCTGQPVVAPMQGHYTGPWHSEGDYHFVTMGYDVELRVTIDGVLDLAVAPDGHVSGTATGKVDAPVYHGGQKDVSSGYGTISGSVSGVLTGGSLLVLSHPIIDMHWGTFVAGGYTVERFITMPDYQLTGPTGDCVSASGSIAENGFPVQNIVDDAHGTVSQVPGVGQATGSWQITSTDAALFAQLSAQVDMFIANANGVLSAPSLTPQQVDAAVVQPLHALEKTIAANPNVARCLLERLGAWERTAVVTLHARAASMSPSGLPQLRSAADLLRVTAAVDADCALSDAGATDALHAAYAAELRNAVGSRDWSTAALLSRDLLLWRGPAEATEVQSLLNTGIHDALKATSDARLVLELARSAHAFGDESDTSAAYARLSIRSSLHVAPGKKKGKGRPRATPTPTPRRKTLAQVLMAGIASIAGHASADGTLSWPSVKGAARYVVVVSAPHGPVQWAWSGTSTAVHFGDTEIAGVPGTAGDGWSVPMPSAAVWSVLALDSRGSIVGLKLR